MKDKVKGPLDNFNKILCEKSLNNSYNNKSLLMRPHFFYFIQSMKKLYQRSYFYIYTASEKKWANKEIAIIEKNNNFTGLRRILITEIHAINNNRTVLKKLISNC